MPTEVNWNELATRLTTPQNKSHDGALPILYPKTGVVYILRPLGAAYEFTQIWEENKSRIIPNEDADKWYNKGYSVSTRFSYHVIHDEQLKIAVVPKSVHKQWFKNKNRSDSQWLLTAIGEGLSKKYKTSVCEEKPLTAAEQMLYDAYRVDLSTVFAPQEQGNNATHGVK